MQLVELINSYFDAVPHSTKENEVTLYCPFCQENGHVGPARLTLGINVLTEVGHCHRCDWRAGGKNLYYQLADEVQCNEEYTPTSGDKAVEEKPKKTKLSLKRVRLPDEYEPLWKDVNERLGRRAKKYLNDRGITDKQLFRHKMGFCGAGKYVSRIILPIMFQSICVGYTARAFQGSLEPKYLISDGDKFLYNYPPRSREGPKRKSRCILVEGPFDVLNLETHIQDYDVIGRQGSSLTDLQLYALSKYKDIVLWPDPDEAGVRGVEKVAKTLKRETDCRLFSIWPCGVDVDPGDMTEKEIKRCVKNIVPWSENLVRKLYVSVLF